MQNNNVKDSHGFSPDNADLAQIIFEIISRLPLSERSCVYFHYNDGMNAAEIAQKLGIDESEVNTLLSSAREKIENELNGRGEKEGLKLWMATPLMVLPALKLLMQASPVALAAGTDAAAAGSAAGVGSAAAGSTATGSTAGVGSAATGSAAGVGGAAATTGATGVVVSTKVIVASVAAVAVTVSIITGALVLGREDEDVSPEPSLELSEGAAVQAATQETIPDETPVPLTELFLDFSNLEIDDEELAKLINDADIPDDIPITLYLQNNHISDLSPLTGLTNLTFLNLDGNQISDISPLSHLTKLQVLALGNNQISDISALGNMTELEFLGLSINQISDVSPLSSLTSLQVLLIADNRAPDVSPLSNLTNLVHLNISANGIEDISSLSSLTNLTILDIVINNITDISVLHSLTNLEQLYLDGYLIGEEPVNELRAALPDCEIDPGPVEW